jgi:hypothetical protein
VSGYFRYFLRAHIRTKRSSNLANLQVGGSASLGFLASPWDRPLLNPNRLAA